MMIKHTSRRLLLLNLLLFTGLGLFSHILLSNWVDFSDRAREVVSSGWGYLFVITAFNLLGFVLLSLSEWINRTSLSALPEGRGLTLTYALVAVLLFILNYGLLVVAKVLAGVERPLFFHNGGEKILLMVWLVELLVVALLLANRSISRALELKQTAARLQEENDRARFEALQNQLNPHFLFNSLNTLVSEIEYNPRSAVRFTRELSEVYRYVLRGQQQRLVSLNEELRFLYSYVYLHQVRLGDCISVVLDFLQEDDRWLLAPLSLQLLAENVIKHNVVNSEQPMVIRLSIDGEGSMLVVSNPLRPKLSSYPEGTGLTNLSNRYRLLCGRDIQVEQGSLFTVRLPLVEA